jgi:hypothetical protein
VETGRSLLRNAKLSQFLCHVTSVRGWTDSLVDVKDPAIGADEKRPARCVRLILVDDTVRGRDVPRGITQQWIVNA